MLDAADDSLLAALTQTASWISESRADGVPARDAAKAMRSVRENRRAAAEEAFGIRRPR
jgi:hypothetical protein